MTVFALSGCQYGTNDPAPVKLGTVEIANRHIKPHSVTVRVIAGDETVYRKDLRLESKNSNFHSRRIDGEIPTVAEKFTFIFKTEFDDEIRTTYSEPHHNECYNLIFAITRQQGLDVLEGMKGACPD